MQQIQMVIREKWSLEHGKGSVSSSKLSAYFTENVAMAKQSEKFTPSFIDAALTIEKRILSQPSCKAILDYWDDAEGIAGPFNSAYKLKPSSTKPRHPMASPSSSHSCQTQFGCVVWSLPS